MWQAEQLPLVGVEYYTPELFVYIFYLFKAVIF